MAVSQRHIEAQEGLSDTRRHIYVASIRARDAVLPSDQPSADAIARVEAAYSRALRALDEYRPVLEEEASGDNRIERLRLEIEALRVEHREVLDPARGLSVAERAGLLAANAGPRRDRAIGVLVELQQINRENFTGHQETMAGLYAVTRRRFWLNLGLALLASLGIVAFAYVQIGRLDRRLRQQRLRDLQNQERLQRLSARLLTAQEEERRSIARDLHDEVGQVLTAVKVELSLAEKKLTAGGVDVAALTDARATTEHALETVRDLSRLLHPSLLDDMGLPAALESYIKGYRKRHGMTVDFRTSGISERLASETEAGVFRIVQEALTNIVRHAETSSCTVEIRREGDELRIALADAGAGFDPEDVPRAGPRQGLGLVSIRERVAHLGGAFRLDSHPGRGTRLEVTVPARPREPEAAGDPAGPVESSTPAVGHVG